jgi:hypothetical protein
MIFCATSWIKNFRKPVLIAPIIIQDEIIVNSSPKCDYGSLAMKGPLVAATAS